MTARLLGAIGGALTALWIMSITGCAMSRPLRPAVALVHDTWRRNPPEHVSRKDRVMVTIFASPPRGSKCAYTLGLWLLSIYWLTGSERAYWRAVDLMTSWVPDQERRMDEEARRLWPGMYGERP